MAKSAAKATGDDAIAQAESAETWINEIDAALKREKNWRDKAAKVVERYRDERTSSDRLAKVNILWSNTEVLKAALYARQAKPDVRRRFPDGKKGNSASRFAAEAVERTIVYCNDLYDIDGPVEASIEDMLLPGRGVVRVDYEPTITGEGDSQAIGHQKLCDRYVYWKDFCHGLARQWVDVPWVAFCLPLRKAEFTAKFPEAKPLPKAADYEMKTAGDKTIDAGEKDKFVEVWELWDKAAKRRIYVARGYRDVLQADDDPLQLTGFFPCPEPLYSVTTNDTMLPEPEYCQYQDQAIELDTVTTRIKALTGYLKWKGVYDGSVDGENKLADLANADDGNFDPYPNWGQLKDKGGIEGAVGFWPMERIIPVLQQLHLRAPQLIDEIYQITGISDIIRGSTDPRETKGAQQLKAQFGSMRMQRRQRDVQRFIRDLYRLKGEIIAEHFTSENLAEITAFDLPSREEQVKLKQRMAQSQAPAPSPALPPSGAPPMAGAGPGLLPPGNPGPAAMNAPAAVAAQPPPQGANVVPFRPGPPIPAGALPTLIGAPGKPDAEMQARVNGPSWDDVMDILRSDKMRGYRIDIETDSTVLEDAQQAKEERIEFATALNDALEKAYLAAVQAPMMLPLIKEEVLFIVRTFKAGRSMEQNVEDAFEALMSNPPAPPADKNAKPEVDPAAEAAKVEAEKAKVVLDKQKVDNDAKSKEAQFALEKQKTEHAIGLEERKFKLSIAAQNKAIYDEAQQEMIDAAEVAGGASAANEAPAVSPMQMMLAGIHELAMVIAQGQQQQGMEIAALARTLAAPKRVVRGADGRAVGVEPMTVQ